MPSERAKIGPVEIPLTREAARVVGWVAAVGAAAAVVIFAAAQIAKLPWWTDGDAVRLSPREAAEMREASRHIVEEPDIALTVFDDARGRSTLRHYRDGCYVLSQSAPDPSVPTRSAWILAPGLAGSGAPPRPDESADLTLATPLHAGEQPCLERGCLNPHPGPFDERVEQLDQCWLRVWRAWPDSCLHEQLYNRCDGAWLPPCWRRCVH